MDKDTKLAIELITGCMNIAIKSRTDVFSPLMMRNLFFEYFVGPARDIPLDKQIEVLGVTMSEVNWAMVFDKITVDNIELKVWFVVDIAIDKQKCNISCKINTDLTK